MSRERLGCDNAFRVAVVEEGQRMRDIEADAVLNWSGDWRPAILEALAYRVMSRSIHVPLSGRPIVYESLRVFLNGRPIDPTTRDGVPGRHQVPERSA